ncbi:MAG: hypothetical protein VYC39_08745 [Myxococcota bacterium]|nr:hypothetical protein [Myxococcota bacterium]
MSKAESSEKDARPDDLTGEFELINVEHPTKDALSPKSFIAEAHETKPLYRADPDRILRVLAANQFEDPFLAFRELYANALDSTRGVDDAKIEIAVTGTQVCFSDNGTGFDDEAIIALTTLGASTRRGQDAIGRFGIGFASIFDPALGVRQVEVLASRPGRDASINIIFKPDVGGGVSIETTENSKRKQIGSRVTIIFDPARAPEDRVTQVVAVLETHAAYSGVATTVNNRKLGKSLSEYVKSHLQAADLGHAERELIAASAVRGPVGVAAIDPTKREAVFRAYQKGLYVGEITIKRPTGQPWIRGVFGAVHAEGLDLVASRNAFVENDAYQRFRGELRRLAFEASYRIVRSYEARMGAYPRVILLDAIRRGLRTTTPEGLLVGSDDLFTSAVIRSPLFRIWGGQERYSFEELVTFRERGKFRALPYRPSLKDQRKGKIFRADDSLERDIFRRLSGMTEMPAAARAEEISKPGFISRLIDRTISGPKAEYSLFQKQVAPEFVPVEIRSIIASLNDFLATEEVLLAFARLMPGDLPTLGYGMSRNVFGPVAAYCAGEIRFNIKHRTLRRLAKKNRPELAARALLPVLAHELAHVCHELHDLDFYRTSRTLLRALVVAAAKSDNRRLTG